MSEMLAIVPGVTVENSSDSSESCNDVESKTIKRKREVDKSTPFEAAGLAGPLQFFHPEASAYNDHENPLDLQDNPADSQNVAKFGFTNEYLQKFAELRAKRVEASQEKVNEGYRRRRRRKRKKNLGLPQDEGQKNINSTNDLPVTTSDLSPESTSRVTEDGPSSSSQQDWHELNEYLDVNSHISQGVDHGKYAQKSGLEKRLDEAVAEGDFDKAEKLSEELSVRNYACKIAKAADARDYMKWKREKDEEKAAKKRKKKKKLAWGAFDVKNRWEMKANM